MAGENFPLIEVAGTSYEMGYQHGAQAAGLVARYLAWIEKLTGLDRDTLARGALTFLPGLERLSPALVEEIKGLADGASVSFEEALLCQVRNEAVHPALGGCTAFALTGPATAGGLPLAGQNQDLEPEFADVAILLRVSPTDGRPRALMFTFAGQLGYAGMNEYGLAHFNNALYDCRWQPHFGSVSRQPVKRVLLEQRSVAAGLDLLARQQFCSASNLVLVDGQGTIADVEIRPEGMALLAPEPAGCHLHTNHYLAPAFTTYDTGFLPDSYPRLARLRALVSNHWGQITVDTLKTILADHEADPGGICRHGARGWHSIAGYIAEPAAGRLHVRRGYGCTGTWHTYEV